MARLRNAVGSVVVAVLALALTALATGRLLQLSPQFPWRVAALFAAAGAIIAVFASRHLGRRPFGAANQVTLTRTAITALLACTAAETATPALAWFCTAAALAVLLLDGVDGWLARRNGQSSAFGARFDMETDALTVLTLAALVWHLDKAGAWVLLGGLLRYLFIVAGRLFPWMRRPLPASRRRQTGCVLQTACLIGAVLPLVPSALSAPLAAAGLITVLWSFGVDIAWLARSRPQFSEGMLS